MNRLLKPADVVTWVTMLGYPSVTETTIRSWAHRGHIATHRTDTGVRYDPIEVQQYLEVRGGLDKPVARSA